MPAAFAAPSGTFRVLKSRHFPRVENIHNFALIVSSEPARRNNSLTHETIFWLWSRHPETQPH